MSTLAGALEALLLGGVSLVSVMRTLVEDTQAALDEVVGGWGRAVGAYPHSGRFVMPNWQFTGMISPEDFAVEAKGWLERCARVSGGCCGIGPDHIRLLRERLPARVSSDT